MTMKLSDCKKLRKIFGRDIIIRVVVTRGEMHLIRVDALDSSHSYDPEESDEAEAKALHPVDASLQRKETYFG